jgi:hypothetical protein
MQAFGIALVAIGALLCLLLIWVVAINNLLTGLGDVAIAIAAGSIAGTGAIILHGLK